MDTVGGRHVTSEEKRRALAELLSSAGLVRSDRLKNLLRFLCEAEIEGRASELTEYEIGVQALGQPAGYSPTENSAVRSRVYELRQKLEKYHSTEAPAAPLQIQLLKGSYVPKFVRGDAIAPEAARPAGRSGRWLWMSALAFVAGSLLTFFVLRGIPAGTSQAKSLWTPELEAIWRPFVDQSVPLLVSFESRLFVRIGSVSVRDWAIDQMSTVESSGKLMSIKQLFHQPQLYEDRNYADFGNVQAAFQIARLLGTKNLRLSLKRSSELGADDTRENDVIFLGKPSTDPALRQLLARGPFLDERLRVRNLDPKPGEPKEYVARPDPKDPEHSGERYLLITLMPGLHQKRRILSLTCFNSEDPWALAEYLTRPEHAKEMYAKMHLSTGKMPDFYQVVVKVVFRGQSPAQIEYVTHRVLPAAAD